MSSFSCQCQNYRGNLVATEKEFYFTSTLFRVDLEWSNVKRIRLETQHVKGVATSVLVVVLQRNEAIRMQASSDSSDKHKRGSASRKYYFYGFQDLLGAEEQIKHLLEQHRAAEKTREKERREEMDKASSSNTRRPEKATEKDDISTSGTEAAKEDSLALARAVVPQRPESEPVRTVAPLSFAGRRVANSTFSRPRIPVKVAASGTLTPPAEEAPSPWAPVVVQAYRLLALALVLLMGFVLASHFARGGAVSDGRYATQTAQRLLQEMDGLAGVTAELESYDNEESLWRYNEGVKRLSDLGQHYTRQIEQAAVELMERYVGLQAQMATLRGQRAAHLARTEQSGAVPPPPPPSMSAEFSTPKKAAAAVRLSATTQSSAGAGAAVPGTPAGGAPSTTRACQKDGTCAKAPQKGKARRLSSLARLKGDLQRWLRRGASAWAFVSRVAGGAASDLPASQPFPAAPAAKPTARREGWVVYSEALSDSFHMTEWVSAAEDEYRHKCLHLTKELLDTLELTERVFASFTNVFLADRYRKLGRGEERASFWLQPPQALRPITNGHRYFAKRAASGDAMARMALLRRFVASLIHSEPLIASQAYRRAFALEVADALVRYRTEEMELLRRRNRGSTANATVHWTALHDLVLSRAAQPLLHHHAVPDSAVYLRNSVEELRFWHTHDAAWLAHVLSFFTPEEQAEIRRGLDGPPGLQDGGEGAEESLPGVATQPGELTWANLPLFRGLLCFESVPSLHESESAAAGNSSGERGLDESDVDGDGADSAEDDGDEGEEAEEEEEGDDDGDADPPSRSAGPSAVVTKPPLPVAPNASTETPAASAGTPTATQESDANASTVFATPTVAHSAVQGSASHAAAEHVELWKEVKLRWMADLEVFRLAFDPQLLRRTSRASRSYRLDREERNVVADSAAVRRRLFGVLALVNEHYVRYLSPNIVQRIGGWLRRLIPPYASSRSGQDVYVSSLQSWGTQDPAVQLAVAQVTGLAPGTTRDVSSSLLYLILQPPPLLQTSMLSARKTLAAGAVLALFVVVLTVLHLLQ